MISVAICTYNRAESLADTLAYFCRLHGQDHLAWELLVIDNNCRDHTQRVIQKFADRLPIRYLEESRQGLSHGRNHAIREARGDLLVFADDDVRPVPEWLSCYVKTAEEYEWAEYFGGCIVPWWPEGKPCWVRDVNMPLLGGLFGAYDLGADIQEYSADHMPPYGANFAVRRSLFERLDPFRVDLGVVGSVPGRGEEAEYLDRARAVGARGIYVPGAVVEHRVDPERLRIRYLYRYGVQKGIAVALTQGHANTARSPYLRGAGYALNALTQWVKGNGDRARQCVINVGIQRGLARQCAYKGNP